MDSTTSEAEATLPNQPKERNTTKNEEEDASEENIEHMDIINERESSRRESKFSKWENDSESEENRVAVAGPKVIDIRPCPLRFIAPCDWLGPSENPNDMIIHCLQIHPANIFLSATQKLLVSRFSVLIPRKYFILFCHLENMFRLTWDLNVDTRVMRFGMYFLHDFGLDLEYVYEIDFLHGRKKVIKLKGPCYYLPNEEDMFLKKNYFSLPYDMVRKYCDVDGSLTFTVKISKETQMEADV